MPVEIPVPYETLPAQLKAILLRFTKSSRLDEMVDELMQAIIRDAPRVEIPIIAEPCNHMSQVLKNPVTGVKELVCKHCKRVQPLIL